MYLSLPYGGGVDSSNNSVLVLLTHRSIQAKVEISILHEDEISALHEIMHRHPDLQIFGKKFELLSRF